MESLQVEVRIGEEQQAHQLATLPRLAEATQGHATGRSRVLSYVHRRPQDPLLCGTGGHPYFFTSHPPESLQIIPHRHCLLKANY